MGSGEAEGDSRNWRTKKFCPVSCPVCVPPNFNCYTKEVWSKEKVEEAEPKATEVELLAMMAEWVREEREREEREEAEQVQRALQGLEARQQRQQQQRRQNRRVEATGGREALAAAMFGQAAAAPPPQAGRFTRRREMRQRG